ncbi:hypothetical protein LguiB_029922 [Lonicera macranthoides]
MNDQKKWFGCGFWGVDDNNKRRSKALKIVVGVSGVESAGLKGTAKDEIEVTGENIDAVELITLLRKNFVYATLVSVDPPSDKEESKSATLVPMVWPSYAPPYRIHDLPTHEPFCSIL